MHEVTGPSILVISNPFEPGSPAARRSLPCRAGQFLCEVLPAEITAEDWTAISGGKVLTSAEWEACMLTPGTELLLYPSLKDTATKIVTGIMFPPLGVYWGAKAMGAPAWASAITMGMFGGALGTALAAKMGFDSILTPTSAAIVPGGGGSGGGETSPTYGFSGIEVA